MTPISSTVNLTSKIILQLSFQMCLCVLDNFHNQFIVRQIECVRERDKRDKQCMGRRDVIVSGIIIRMVKV